MRSSISFGAVLLVSPLQANHGYGFPRSTLLSYENYVILCYPFPQSSSTEVLASMMESYKAQMDAALKEQQAATAALRAHIEDTLSAPSIRAVSAPARKTSRAKPVAPPNDSPTDMIKRDSFDAESDSISSSAGSDIGIPPPKGLSTPIATLRRKLTHFAHQQQEVRFDAFIELIMLLIL